MSYRFKELFLSLTIVAMLLFSAFGTTTAYADDDPTSGTPAGTETTVTSTDGQPPVTGTETPPPTEAPVVDPAATPVDAQAAEPILAQLPENTTVTVLDAQGEALPLASLDTAAAIASTYDPIWCPAGVAPGSLGCTGSFNSFDELLTFLKTNEGDVAYQQAGVIYIQKDQYLGGESTIDFNNYGFTTINNYDLTLQGGWNTVDNTVNPADTTQFAVPIIIGSSANPWAGALTINNISISGAVGQPGLSLFSQGNVNLANVAVTNSQAGANIQTTGAVAVTDSSFNGNEDYGIQIDSTKEASLVNIKADQNKSGAHIKADVVAIDTASFSNNGSGGGLYVDSLNDVALFGVDANNNQSFGANIFAGALVAIAQSNFNDGSGFGLSVVTKGLVDLDSVNANNNDLYGAYIEGGNTTINNSFFTANGSLGIVSEPVGYGLKVVSTGSVNLTNINAADSIANQLFSADITAAKNVNILNSFFSGQQSEIFIPSDGTTEYYGYGLNVVTPGDIFLNFVVGNYNNLWGANLAGRDVAVYNSQFNNNVTDSTIFIDDTGLLVNASGFVDIYKTEAKENRLIGATITAVGDVYVADSNFSDNRGITCIGTDCYNVISYGYGLSVITSANIFVTGTTANNNYLFGATLSGKNVEVADSTFDFNGTCIERAGIENLIVDCVDPAGQGLIVTSVGNTSLNHVSASHNELFGADITAGGNVTITASVFSGNQSYTIYRDGVITVNGYGLKVTADGDILLNADANGIGNEASDNLDHGAILTGKSAVTVSDSVFNNNGTSGEKKNGLTITVAPAGGNVTLNNVTASNTHRQDGVNVTGFCTNTVFVNGGTFANNDRYGLNIKLSTLVLDGTQTFGNNAAGDIFTNSNTCPPVAVPPVVPPVVIVPPVVAPPVVIPPADNSNDIPNDTINNEEPATTETADNETTNNDANNNDETANNEAANNTPVNSASNNAANNSNPSSTTISTSTNNHTTMLNKGSDGENHKGSKGDKTFKFRKNGVGKIKIRGIQHFKTPCFPKKVTPI